jgi:hypothetical protein
MRYLLVSFALLLVAACTVPRQPTHTAPVPIAAPRFASASPIACPAGSPQGQTALLSQFSDLAAPGSILPSNIRAIICADVQQAALGNGVYSALGNAANASGGFAQVPVPNAALANSSITVNGTPCTLGSSCSPSGGGTPGGANGSIQYNNNGAFGGITLGTGVSAALGNNTNSSSGFPTVPVASSALASTTVTPGSYTNSNITVNAQGQVTAAANGSSSGGITGPTAGDVMVSPGSTGAATGIAAAAGQCAFGSTSSAWAAGYCNGVFNVRLQFGAAPDGSTDNSTAIGNAFTASNAFTNGTPTVYFDCNPGTTACEYNYGGSSISPINPTVPTTILCAPSVTLNYTGNAHAADIGPTGLTQVNTDRYTIQGCRWTGGASYTAGIYINTYIANTLITRNEFRNFGNQTYYTIVYNGNDWTPVVEGNYWSDTDGVTRNMIDAHTGVNVGLLYVNNKNECETSGGSACSVSTVGVGLWLFTGWVLGNEIKYHYPAVRISSCASCGGGQGFTIRNNLFEGNSNGTSPAITYGDPGGTGNVHIGIQPHIEGNTFYWPTTGNVPFIGPETPASGSYYLPDLSLIGNGFKDAPNGTTPYVNINGDVGFYGADNHDASGNLIGPTSTNPIVDTGYSVEQGYFAMDIHYLNGSSPASSIPVADTTGLHYSKASFHNFAAPLACPDSSGSGTTQACVTAPEYNTAGTKIALSSGDQILYTTTTTNTGDLTIAVNGGTAYHVRKLGGALVLAAGDMPANIPEPLTFDGTYLEMPISGLVVPTSCTGLPTGALYNNGGTPGFC